MKADAETLTLTLVPASPIEGLQEEIYRTFREVEMKYRPQVASSMGMINYKHRSVLIDWLSDVATEWELTHETLLLVTSN